MCGVTTAATAKEVGLHPHTLATFARQNIVPGEFIGGPRGWNFDVAEVRAALTSYWGNKAKRRLVGTLSQVPKEGGAGE